MQPDIFDLLNRVSKGAFSVFCSLKYHRDVEINTAHVELDDQLTRTQKETISRKLKELRSVDLIRPVVKKIQTKDRTMRFKRGTFIINPELIRCSNHDMAELIWNQCPKETINESNQDVSEEEPGCGETVA